MDGITLQKLCAERALALPGTRLTQPFGPEADVYKVHDKMFLLASAGNGDPIVTLKALPADVQELCHAFDQITPGYHMNKRHWITVRGGTGLDGQFVEDLVTESYLLVVGTLPRGQRPVDPATFGRGSTRAMDFR